MASKVKKRLNRIMRQRVALANEIAAAHPKGRHYKPSMAFARDVARRAIRQ